VSSGSVVVWMHAASIAGDGGDETLPEGRADATWGMLGPATDRVRLAIVGGGKSMARSVSVAGTNGVWVGPGGERYRRVGSGLILKNVLVNRQP